jgi:hypothetical protein
MLLILLFEDCIIFKQTNYNFYDLTTFWVVSGIGHHWQICIIYWTRFQTFGEQKMLAKYDVETRS